MKQTFSIAKLYFREPLALMSEKKDEFQNEVLMLPSDMIKAALMSALAMVGTQVEIDKLNEGLIVSSAFPFFEEHYFFPRPMSALPVEHPTRNPKNRKTVKKIRFIEKPLFEKVLRAEKFLVKEENFIHGNKFLVQDKKKFALQAADGSDMGEKIYDTQTVGRVSLGNLIVLETGEKGSPYYVSRTYFRQGGGLFFIYKTKDEELFRKAMDMWQSEGTGADRRIGNGHFTYKLTEIDLDVPDNADRQMILSKYIPEKDEVAKGLLSGASYMPSVRGGYVAGTSKEAYAHWLKNKITVLDESSVFPKSFALQGRNVMVSNEKLEAVLGHKVYRDGRAISIPIKITENG